MRNICGVKKTFLAQNDPKFQFYKNISLENGRNLYIMVNKWYYTNPRVMPSSFKSNNANIEYL